MHVGERVIAEARVAGGQVPILTTTIRWSPHNTGHDTSTTKLARSREPEVPYLKRSDHTIDEKVQTTH
jgi:hypothetical protein